MLQVINRRSSRFRIGKLPQPIVQMLLYFCLFFIWARITVQPLHFIFEIAHCEQILKKFLKLLKFLLHQTKVVKILCLFISYSNKSIVVKKKSFIVLCVHLKKYQQIVKYLCLFFNTNDFYLPPNSLFSYFVILYVKNSSYRKLQNKFYFHSFLYTIL